MAEDEPDASRAEDEPEVTDLRPRRVRTGSRDARLPRLGAWAWQRLTLGLSLLLLLAVLLSSLPLVRDAVGRLAHAPATPTASAAPPALPTPPAPFAAPTALPGITGVPALDPAPASCGGQPPALTSGLAPPFGMPAVGMAPVWVGGFVGPYATLRLGPAASASAYGWAAPYTRYGWPAPIGLLLQPGFAKLVTLTGWNPRDGHPLWFGFIIAGVWGAPAEVVPTFAIDPANPSIPAGGAGNTGVFWYGYAFLPRAGCYTLAASWPGGGWKVMISAGR